MHVFVTGATGWVGLAVVEDLIRAGHQVTGLARSADKAAALAVKGAQFVHNPLHDLDLLRRAAATADAVIHTAFDHDFSKSPESAAQDERVIQVLGSVLAGSDRSLLVTSGLFCLARGATETDLPNPASPRKSEAAARALAERGVRAATVRLAPSVHGIGDHGFIPILIRPAREKRVSAYLEDGTNCWSGLHRLDAAPVYRLALERGVTIPAYHAVADPSRSFQGDRRGYRATAWPAG